MHRRADTALELPREGREARHKNEKKRKEGRGKKNHITFSILKKKCYFSAYKGFMKEFSNSHPWVKMQSDDYLGEAFQALDANGVGLHGVCL